MRVSGQPVVFLARHGEGHTISPTELNFRANIWALKSLGVKAVFSLSAVGSLRENIQPGHMVVIDQFFDRTRERVSTFFDGGIVAHVTFAHPVSEYLRSLLITACLDLKIPCHGEGTYLCMEGPQFSTKAESEFYRNQVGASVIGMTNLQEAKLAREAEMDYATLALSTDYDCWHEDHDSVTVDQVMATMKANIENGQKVLHHAIKNFDFDRHLDAEKCIEKCDHDPSRKNSS